METDKVESIISEIDESLHRIIDTEESVNMREQQDLDGTRRIPASNTIKIDRQADYKEYEADYKEYETDYRDEYSGKNTLLVAITFILAIAVTAVITYMVCMITGQMGDGALRNENKDLNLKVERLESEIVELQSTIEELKSDTAISSAEHEEALDIKDAEITVLKSELEELQETLEATELELKEMQFRADMYQKYGFWEW